ncbi:MAG TPA: ribonuclease P protein component [Xanthobacteraceae bacterium]
MERLKRRSDFRAAAQAAARGARASARAFVLQARQRGEAGPPRVGFTVSKQVGNAVERNRVRRRLRELVRVAAAAELCVGHDYVLVGRPAALRAEFDAMMRDLAAALDRIHASSKASRGTGVSGNQTPHRTGSPGRSQRQEPGRHISNRNTANRQMSNRHIPDAPPHADDHEH